MKDKPLLVEKLKDEIQRLKEDLSHERQAQLALQAKIVSITQSPSFKPLKAYRELKKRYEALEHDLNQMKMVSSEREEKIADLTRTIRVNSQGAAYCPRCGLRVDEIRIGDKEDY